MVRFRTLRGDLCPVEDGAFRLQALFIFKKKAGTRLNLSASKEIQPGSGIHMYQLSRSSQNDLKQKSTFQQGA